MWDAESIWFQRVKLHEQIVVPSVAFNPDMKETVNGLIQQSTQWKELIDGVTELKLPTCF
jgi:hypothetical protein